MISRRNSDQPGSPGFPAGQPFDGWLRGEIIIPARCNGLVCPALATDQTQMAQAETRRTQKRPLSATKQPTTGLSTLREGPMNRAEQPCRKYQNRCSSRFCMQSREAQKWRIL
jgi:hypothetical protein